MAEAHADPGDINCRHPCAASGLMSAGIPMSGLEIGRHRTYRGARHSYVSARCEARRLRARGEFTFDDDTKLRATFSRRCSSRR